MRVLLSFVCALALLCVPIKTQAVNDPTLGALLQRAATGKDAYLEAVDEFGRSLPETPQGPHVEEQTERIFDWVGSLDEWNRLGQGFGFSSPYETGLAEAALRLTRNAAPVLHLRRHAWERVKQYLRWSDDYSRLIVAQQQARWVSSDSDKKTLLFWHGRLAGTIRVLDALKAQTFAKDAFAEVDSVVMAKLFLVFSEVTDDEMGRVLARCDTLVSIQAALEGLAALASGTETFARQGKVLEWTLQLHEKLKAWGVSVPPALRAYPGRVVIDALTQFLALTDSVPTPPPANLMAALEPAYQSELAGTLVEIFHDRGVHGAQLDYVFELCRTLLRAQKERGLAAPSRDLDRFVQRLALDRLERDQRFEGTYRVRVGGSDGVVTLVRSGGGSVLAALQKFAPNTGITFSFFRVTYDADTGVFLAHRFSAEAVEYLPPDLTNTHFTFRLAPRTGGKSLHIDGVFNNGEHRWGVSGTQTARLEPFPELSLEAQRKPRDSFDGIFAGGGWKLSITQVAQEVSGNLTREPGIGIALPTGFFDSRRGVTTLNSGEQTSGAHIQVRGRISEDGRFFDGYYIIGGRGFARLHMGRVR